MRHFIWVFTVGLSTCLPITQNENNNYQLSSPGRDLTYFWWSDHSSTSMLKCFGPEVIKLSTMHEIEKSHCGVVDKQFRLQLDHLLDKA